ncbi:MAG: formylglycine-generating enzyme family protein [Polyangiaceae bacterium]
MSSRASSMAVVSGLLVASRLVACSASSSNTPPETSSHAASSAAPSASSSEVVEAPAPAVSSSPVASASASAKPTAPPGMALVPAGTFKMGLNKGGEQDEAPEHNVTLKAFYLDLTEVTNEAYYECVNAGVCPPHDANSAQINKVGDDKKFRRPKQPISAISWDDSKKYCQWKGKRLPSEAEWERAARGDDGRMFPWGNDKPTHEHAVFGEGATSEVGSRPKGAGPYGHLDMAGNVWEWVEDMYDPFAYRRKTASEGVPGSCEEILATQNELRRNGMQGFTGTNPIPAECEHVLRGGAFNYEGRGLRSSNRVHHAARFHLVMSGFRCAKDAELSVAS